MRGTPPDIDPNGRYNATQAAALLEINRSTLYRYVKRGMLRIEVTHKSISAKYKGKDLLQLWRTI